MKKSKVKKRLFKVVKVFFKIFLDFRKEFKIRNRKGFKYAEKKMSHKHTKRATELYNLATEMGGVLIKLCQYFSTRRDIFPAPYVEVLSQLQDSVEPIGFSEIKGVLDTEYKNNTEEHFEFIDKEPLASASLGQTHRAKLKTGEDVVLKVLKPGVEDIIDIDFAIIYHVIKFFSNFKVFKQAGDFDSLLKEFISVTGDELNFKREAYLSAKFREFFKDDDSIAIPYIYEELSTYKIIVMEYFEGYKITDTHLWSKGESDNIEVARRLVGIYLRQFLELKIIHYDPHPGNILIGDDNKIHLLDFGMAGFITDRMKNDVKLSLKHFINKDYMGIIDLMGDMGFLRRGANKRKLYSVMRYLFEDVVNSVKLERESIQNVDLSPIIDDLIEIIYSQPLNLPIEWAYTGRTIGTLVGIISGLYPDFNIYNEIKPYADKLLKESFEDITKTIFEEIKSYATLMYRLPPRVERFIDNMEDQNIRFKLETEDLEEEIVDFENKIARFLGLSVTFLSGLTSYLLHTFDKSNESFALLIFTSLVFTGTIAYKKKTKKQYMKKNLTNR